MSNSACANSTQNWQDVLFVSVYSVVFLIGLVLNLTALVIFYRNSKLRSHTTMYMIHLAVADILMICTLPVRIYYHAGLGVPHEKFCELTGVMLLSNMYSSIFLLTCISFDRCVAVCFPLSSRVREGRKKAWCICLAIWVLTMVTSLPIYFKNRSNPSTKHNTSSVCFGRFPNCATQPGPLFGTLTVGFGIPLIVMIISSWGLIRAVGKSTAVQTSNLVDSVRITRMIITNLAIFLLCFLPYHVLLVLLNMYGGTCELLTAYHFSLMMACLNAMLDPLAYYFATETFRKKMDIGAVRKIRQMNSHSSDGNNRSRAPLTT